MSRFQIAAIAICVIINMIDGFDVLAIAFTAPQIAQEWSITPERLGVLFSMGLAGMMVGSLLVAPLADQYGRRWAILTSLVVVTAGMLLSAFCTDIIQLSAMRLLTGIGVGTMLPSINTMVAEYASSQRRSLSIAILGTGYPLGAMLGGVLAVYLIAQYGWPSVFILGGLFSLILIPLVYFRLPESLAYLLARRPVGALDKINEVLAKLDYDSLESLPDSAPARTRKIPVLDTLAPDIRKNTVLFCLAFFLLMTSFYFVMSWTPKLLVNAGLSMQQGISGGVLLNVGGLMGQLLFGVLATRLDIQRVILGFMLTSVLLMLAMTIVGSALTLMLGLAFLMGISLFGAFTGLYALAPLVFDAQLRNTGTGMAIGIGRLGAVFGPLLAGFLLAWFWTAAQSYAIFALPILASAVSMIMIRNRNSLTGAAET
jgi:benzoate transport